MKFALPLSLALLGSAAMAGETAWTVKATELKDKPYTDAGAVGTLAERSKVEVLARQASWTQVKAGNATGWVKMLNLRLDNPDARSGNTGVGALFNLARTGKSGTVATTGVRGLDEAKLAGASPNGRALEQMNGYAVGKEEARGFAKDGKLSAQDVARLGKGGKS
jgi:hypothetical protein